MKRGWSQFRERVGGYVGLMRTVVALTASVVLLVALPSMAAGESFAGQSQQGMLVKLRTQSNGELRRLEIRWKTDDCAHGSRIKRHKTSFIQPFDRSRPGSFADQGAFTERYTDGRIRIATSASGELVSPGRWKGRFKVKATIEFDSGSTDVCRLGPISWNARS
jgi:hypothetical protein